MPSLGVGEQNLTDRKNNKTTNQDTGWLSGIQMLPCLNSHECWHDASRWEILHTHSWTVAGKTQELLKWSRKLLSGHVDDEIKVKLHAHVCVPSPKVFHYVSENISTSKTKTGNLKLLLPHAFGAGMYGPWGLGGSLKVARSKRNYLLNLSGQHAPFNPQNCGYIDVFSWDGVEPSGETIHRGQE